VEELAPVRALVDRGEARLETEQPDSPLMRLGRAERRRILAVAAFRELRSLRRELDAERAADPGHIDGV
jgi:hypothetical protein